LQKNPTRINEKPPSLAVLPAGNQPCFLQKPSQSPSAQLIELVLDYCMSETLGLTQTFVPANGSASRRWSGICGSQRKKPS
jgi:hypothetical protein